MASLEGACRSLGGASGSVSAGVCSSGAFGYEFGFYPGAVGDLHQE